MVDFRVSYMFKNVENGFYIFVIEGEMEVVGLKFGFWDVLMVEKFFFGEVLDF